MKAKDLIVNGDDQRRFMEADEEMPGMPPRGGPPRPGGSSRPGGPPRPMRPPGARPRGPGGPDMGMGDEPGGGGLLSPRERQLMKDMVILDLLHAIGGESFYRQIADIALEGTDPTPEQIRHFMDEAPKYANEFKPGMNELMNKLASQLG